MKIFTRTLCLYLACILLLTVTPATAQKTDTLIIQPKDINTKVLIPGTHRWLVYFKAGKDSIRTNFAIWSRKIDLITYQGKEAISVTQEWENKDSIIHKVYTVCDRKDFSTLYQHAWTKGNGIWEFDFLKKEMIINGKRIGADDTARVNTARRLAFESATSQYTLNWHLDLEVFPLLPYKVNTTFMINFYDPGFPKPKLVTYTVIGSGILTGSDNRKIDCWLLQQQGTRSTETFWISKKTKEVLKLEQEELGSGKQRFKVKLDFVI